MVIVNIILLNILWFATVMGAANETLWPAYLCLLLLLATTFVYDGMNKKAWQVIGISVLFGVVIDGFLMNSGLVYYASHTEFLPWLPPIWILSLWLGFGASITTGMQWMLKYPALGALFIIIGAPLSYLSAAKLGAIEIPHLTQALSVIAVSWLIYFVGIVYIIQTKAKEGDNNALV